MYFFGLVALHKRWSLILEEGLGYGTSIKDGIEMLPLYGSRDGWSSDEG